MDVGCFHGAAAVWKELGKASGCFRKSYGCLPMVLGPGSAFELGVTSRFQLCSCMHTKILLKAMK